MTGVVTSAAIADAVRSAIAEAAVTLRPDVLSALEAAAASETSPRGRAVLTQLVENAAVACSDRVPLCQDTGTVWVRVEIGCDESPGGDLQAAVDAAVADAFRANALRMSTVRDALWDRSNPGDNTPAFLEVVPRPGTGAVCSTVSTSRGASSRS